MLAQPDRRRRRAAGRHRQPQFRQSREARRSWASSSRRSRASARPARALDFPIVSGNVSLYNETNGQAILPTPTIGGVGLIEDCTQDRRDRRHAGRRRPVPRRRATARISAPRSICARSTAARTARPAAGRPRRREAQRRLRPRPDPRRHASATCHDLSDGGLAVALAEMCMASGIGASVDAGDGSGHARLFGEDQARYVVAVAPDRADSAVRGRASSARACRSAGSATAGGDRLVVAEPARPDGGRADRRPRELVPGLHVGQIVEPAAAA